MVSKLYRALLSKSFEPDNLSIASKGTAGPWVPNTPKFLTVTETRGRWPEDSEEAEVIPNTDGNDAMTPTSERGTAIF